MDHTQASDRLVELVNDALDAGLQGSPRPEPIPLGYDTCTDDILGPTSQARPTFEYVFALSELPREASSFAEKATDAWENKGMDISREDSEGILSGFAVSDDGFHLSLTVNTKEDQVYIGGSGPCVDPPDE
jgi:hypothetical protein